MYQSLYSNKIAGLMAETLLKKRPRHRCFPVNVTKLLGILFLHSTSGRLFLCLNISTIEFYPGKRTIQGTYNLHHNLLDLLPCYSQLYRTFCTDHLKENKNSILRIFHFSLMEDAQLFFRPF